MKKNILTVVIMAATVINLVLTIVLVFSIMPAMQKTTNLIDKVASVIDLEIEDKNKDEEYTIADLESFPITYDSAQKLGLAAEEGDTTLHVFMIEGMTISFNMKAEDYQQISEMIKGDTSRVEDIVNKTVGSYTKSNFDQVKVASECVKKIQELYDTKCVVDLIFIKPLVA
jgi:flagellar FliL protein